MTLPGGVYGQNHSQPQRILLVAPIFKKTYAIVFKQLGLENVPTDEFMAWYRAYLEARASPEWESDDRRPQVYHDYVHTAFLIALDQYVSTAGDL